MKANIPKSWLTLPEKEKQIIYKLVEDQFNKTIDHEEAELQKRWLQLACIVLHRQKDRFGLGQYYRGITEHCLFASTKKRLPYKVIDGKRAQGVTGFCEAKTIHSRKPRKMREMIERVSYAPRIELFAREHFDGWDCWGNEC